MRRASIVGVISHGVAMAAGCAAVMLALRAVVAAPIWAFSLALADVLTVFASAIIVLVELGGETIGEPVL
jgi:hypothetical protein